MERGVANHDRVGDEGDAPGDGCAAEAASSTDSRLVVEYLYRDGEIDGEIDGQSIDQGVF